MPGKVREITVAVIEPFVSLWWCLFRDSQKGVEVSGLEETGTMGEGQEPTNHLPTEACDLVLIFLLRVGLLQIQLSDFESLFSFGPRYIYTRIETHQSFKPNEAVPRD